MIGRELGTLLMTRRSPHGHDRTDRPGHHVGSGVAVKALTNLVGSVVTGDMIADAVFVYHSALVARRRATLVQLPVLGEQDRIRRANIAIGWLTGLVTSPEPNRGREVEDPAVANELRSLARELRAEPAPPQLGPRPRADTEFP